jgi:hypothetical protein
MLTLRRLRLGSLVLLMYVARRKQVHLQLDAPRTVPSFTEPRICHLVSGHEAGMLTSLSNVALLHFVQRPS